MGFGMAGFERHAYDPQNGLPNNVSLHQAKIPTYLDVAADMDWAAIDLPDPQNPIGAKGIGEPLQGCAAARCSVQSPTRWTGIISIAYR